MIRIGNQTSRWAATPAEPFDYAVANGFDAFEWFPDKKSGVGWDDGDLDASHRQRIKETAIGKGIRLSVHARWQANPLDSEAAESLRKDIQLAKDLGAVLLNIHLHQEAGIERFVSAITPLIFETADAGLQLSIENTPEHSPEEFNELFSRLGELDAVPIEHIGMCLDLGHANLSGATRNDYLRFVDRLDRDLPIIHLHLHENWGDEDTHLTLFTGPAKRDDSGVRGFLERIQKRHFSGSIIFEQWPQPPSLLIQARDRLLVILEDRKNFREPIKEQSTGRGGRQQRNRRVELKKPDALVATQNAGGRDVSRFTDGPHAASAEAQDFFESLVEGDKNARSWREKLDAVRELIVSKDSALAEEELAYIAIYLRFLSTGQIACVEDGRHFRPGHHARISQEIQKRLQKVTKAENAFVIRMIYAALPSSAQEFQRAEPLTRIRDIAHRNDISSDLKREIKTTLQNKLHRCAGPEDLETSQKLLERITAPEASYSAEFVQQFQIFHEELKEFFNAKSLDERLNSIRTEVVSEQGELIGEFLEQKLKSGFEKRLSTFKTLTRLRDWLRLEIEKEADGQHEKFIAADIGLEDFAFALLSQLLNDFEASEPGRSGTALLEALELLIHNIALSGISVDECEPIGAELNAWRKNFDPGDREQLLRMKATIERCRRLAELFSERVIGLMLLRAEKLGNTLGVAEHAIRVFCEAEIRSHLVFQLSKIVSLLLKRIRDALGLPAWDVLVSGSASGRVKVLERLDGGENHSEPIIAALRKAEGGEEIPRAVRGILLAHEIPHLSHLGVRARQAGVVFVAAEDSSTFNALEKLNDEVVQLNVAPDKVEWARTDDGKTAERSANERVSKFQSIKINAVLLREGDPVIIPIEQVTVEKGGQKALGLRKLGEIQKGGFLVPAALVVPFGTMERALSANRELSAQYFKLAKELQKNLQKRIEAEAKRLRTIIEQLHVPDEIAALIGKTFGADVRLMVRSSANCEDLEDFAGAGLYESIPDVQPTEAAPAIRRVWSSLWTRRAVLSRNQAGIPHEQAQMAVLIQEMIAPEYSFILHTANPLNHNVDELYAEIAVGLGETLASAAVRGTPYRLVCNKRPGEVRTLAFANFSHALQADSKGAVRRELIDYSRVQFSQRSELRREVGRKLARIGKRVEDEFGKAQDIEGAIVGDKIYLVQSRPQQGL